MNDDSVLMLGIGNLLWADEGFGVRCVEAFAARYATPEHVTLMDGGTQGLYLLPHVQAARRMLVFDAVDAKREPGTLLTLRDGDVPRFLTAKKMSLHQSSFMELLALARLSGEAPRQITVIGVQPVLLDDYGGSLSPAVRARVPEALGLALAELRAWGIDVSTREAVSVRADPLALDAYEAGRPSAQAAWRFGDARVVNEMLGS